MTNPMKTSDTSKIDFVELGPELHKYERQWIAITTRNEIIDHGRTYAEALKVVKDPREVILFKVPPAGMLAVVAAYPARIAEGRKVQ